jgi:hypothetical protein
VGTLHHLKLAFAQDTWPAFWSAVGTMAHLRSLHLYTISDAPYLYWDEQSPWELPHLRRLALDIDRYRTPMHHDEIFAFLGRCSFPGLQELEVRASDELRSFAEAPAVGRFLGSHPAAIRLTIDGPRSLTNDIIRHALAETVCLSRFPDASAVANLSPRIRILRVSTAPSKKNEDRLLAVLEALINNRPLHARLACVKLDFKDKDRKRSEILSFAHRLHEQNITLLDANDERYHG